MSPVPRGYRWAVFVLAVALVGVCAGPDLGGRDRAVAPATPAAGVSCEGQEGSG